MNKYLTAAENARRLLTNLELVKQVAEAFELVGSLEQATVEAQAAHAAALVPLQKAVADRQEAEGHAAAARADADQVDVAATAASRAAQSEAASILTNARLEAHDTVAAARQTAKADIEDAAERVKKSNAACAEVAAQVDALQAKLEKLKAQAVKLLG